MVNPEMLILARESRGLNQGELAKLIDVTQGKISKYENGLLIVSAEDKQKLADALGYTPEFFDENGAAGYTVSAEVRRRTCE